jgi:hypothetical protein
LAFPSKGGKVPYEYSRYVICRRMGWDYFTFNSQPAFFINEISECMEAEDKAETIKQAKNKNNG